MLPDDFIWDRYFGEIIAPIGEYPVTVKAWDTLGNSSTAHGEIVIPEPDPPGETASASATLPTIGSAEETAEEIALFSDPFPHPSSGAGGPAGEREPQEAEAEESEPPAASLSTVASAAGSSQEGATAATSEGGGTGLLWAAAALAAAAAATETASPPAFDLAKWKQQDYAQSEEWEQERSSGSATRPTRLFSDPVQFISEHADVARNALRGLSVYILVQAARTIKIGEVTTTLRIRGSPSARSILGLREKVNWLRPENIERLTQSPALRAVRALKSWGVAFGIGLNLANDTTQFIEGDHDRLEYASALTIDTGATIAGALIAGGIAGAVSGGLIGAGLGTVAVPIPILGTVSGAAIAGVVGGIIGIGAAAAAMYGFQASGVRDLLIDKGAGPYRAWTGTTH